MAVVDLNSLPVLNAPPEPFAVSGWRGGEGGGAIFWQGALGDRWMLPVETAMMKAEPDLRRALALVSQAERLGGKIEIPQPDFNVGAPGTPTVAADTASGRTVPLTGLTPHYAIRAGQWVTIVVDGRGYLDEIVTPVVADASGEAEIELRNLIRKGLSEDDVVELGRPWIEGAVTVTRRAPNDINRAGSFAFTITELR